MAEIRGGACEVIDDLLQKVAERMRIIRLYADSVSFGNQFVSVFQ